MRENEAVSRGLLLEVELPISRSTAPSLPTPQAASMLIQTQIYVADTPAKAPPTPPTSHSRLDSKPKAEGSPTGPAHTPRSLCPCKYTAGCEQPSVHTPRHMLLSTEHVCSLHTLSANANQTSTSNHPALARRILCKCASRAPTRSI